MSSRLVLLVLLGTCDRRVHVLDLGCLYYFVMKRGREFAVGKRMRASFHRRMFGVSMVLLERQSTTNYSRSMSTRLILGRTHLQPPICQVCKRNPVRIDGPLCSECSHYYLLLAKLWESEPKLTREDLERVIQVFEWQVKQPRNVPSRLT